MKLWEQIIEVYPELTNKDFHPDKGIIELRDDADGFGQYIAKWEYQKPIPAGLKLGKD
jgi:hypothetical protein